MPSLEEQVFLAIRSALVAAQAVGQPLEYIKTDSLRDGRFLTEPSGAFPVIMLEPDTVSEEPHSAPERVRLVYRYSVYCAVEHMDFGKSIVGDISNKGIVDLVNDVKNVLSADLRLGLASSGVLRIRFPSTRYFVDNYPIREAVVNVEVEATTTKQGR